MIYAALILAMTSPQIEQQCIYTAGVASTTQEIRQSGETWEQFKEATSKIYKEGEGYSNILTIASLVYTMDKAVEPDDVFQKFYDTCKEVHQYRKKNVQEFNL